jgi:hypothetical protein
MAGGGEMMGILLKKHCHRKTETIVDTYGPPDIDPSRITVTATFHKDGTLLVAMPHTAFWSLDHCQYRPKSWSPHDVSPALFGLE